MAKYPGTHRKDHPFRTYWTKPWLKAARESKRFREFCWSHGFVSPHFTRKEWMSKDGTNVPESLQANAQKAAFRLEQLRHALGDKPLGGLSYYRSPGHNRDVGGASQSRHMSADAVDFQDFVVDSFPRSKFMAEVEKLYKNDGVGIYPGGNVHLDTRGVRARWSSW